jgi:hypothetical protein
MRNLALACLISGLWIQPAFAGRVPDNSRLVPLVVPPGAALRPARQEAKLPYPMTYADEAAQTLGIRDGRLDLFSTHPGPDNPMMPVVSGGISGNGAMLRLQWRQGQ